MLSRGAGGGEDGDLIRVQDLGVTGSSAEVGESITPLSEVIVNTNLADISNRMFLLVNMT